MRKKLSKFILFSFLFSGSFLLNYPTHAGMEDEYKRQKQCTWKTATYQDINDQSMRYCIQPNGFIQAVGEDPRFPPINLKEQFNKRIKYSEQIITLVGSKWVIRLAEIKKVGDKLVQYKCEGGTNSDDFQCYGPIEKTVLGISLVKVKEKAETELIKNNYLKDADLLMEESYKLGASKGIKSAKSAISLYTKIIELDPNSMIAYRYRGLLKYKIGNYQDSINDLNKSISLNPNDSLSYIYRGNTKKVLGLIEDAIKDFKESIRINPSNHLGYLELGIIDQEKGNHEKAILNFNKSIARKPYYGRHFYYRGISKSELNDCKSAIEDFDYAIESYSYHGDRFYKRGICKFRLEQYNSALLDLDQALKLNPKDLGILEGTAMIKLKLKNYISALDDYDNVISFYEKQNTKRSVLPRIAKLYNNRAYTKNQLKKYKSALRDLNIAIDMNSKNNLIEGLNYKNRGFTYFGLGNLKRACKDWEKASSLGNAQATEQLQEKCS